MLNGTYKDFYAADLTGTELIDVMFGSFAYAGFFAPENAMGSSWFDGSTIWDHVFHGEPGRDPLAD